MKLQLLLERNFLIEIDEIRQYVFINGKLLNIYHNVFMFSVDLCPSPKDQRLFRVVKYNFYFENTK